MLDYPVVFDFRHPDYLPVFQQRLDRLAQLRADPRLMAVVRRHYATHPADFINDWGVTFDPRNADVDLPSTVPFLLFPKQREWCDWVVDHWKTRRPGITEKSRDMGMSWLSVALACSLCLFNPGIAIGFGSRKEEYVDKSDSPKSLFYKARMFMRYLPEEFKGGWDAKKHAPHMRLSFPGTRSVITGEAGDGIGRGDRATMYFVDESAFLERPQLVDAALSQTTNCRMDISTPNGLGNPFAQKRFGGNIDVFTFNWRDDPRKDEAWYAKQLKDIDDPVVVAQEIDLNYSASVEGVLLPSAWVQAAVDAHHKLGLTITGERVASLDVADEGKDKNAQCVRQGILVERIDEWSGQGADIFKTVQQAFRVCDEAEVRTLRYDADGLGAGVRGDGRVINEGRPADAQIELTTFRGSGAVLLPEGEDVKGRTNQDYFLNFKAQSWWALRKRFQNTYRALHESAPYDSDEIISLSSTMPNLAKLTMELSQPTYSQNGVGKLLVDKAPDGARSPNLADAVMIAYARLGRAPMLISEEALRALALV